MRLRLKCKRLDWSSLLKSILFTVFSLGVTGGAFVLLKRVPSINPTALGIIGTIGALAAIYPTARNVSQQIKSLEQKLSQYIKNPNYQEKIGFLAKFEEDLARVIDLVTQKGKWPLVVFIDDLDRCAPTKAVEVIEAINILLDAKHCVFVIGMDAKTVAESIQAKYSAVEVGRPDESGGLTLGQRFLEKIVQINFRIPRPHKDQVERLIDKHLEGVEFMGAGKAVQNIPEMKVKLAEQIIQAEQRGGKELSEAIDLATTKIAESDLGISRNEIGKASEELRMKAFEDDHNVRQAVKGAAPYLDHNPRKIKRFINNFRVYARIAQKRGLMSSAGFDIELLAKATIITMQWPDLAIDITKDQTIFQTLKDGYQIQPLPRHGSQATDQLVFSPITSEREAFRGYINSADLAKLLGSIEDSDMTEFARCFQFHEDLEQTDKIPL